MELKEVMNVMQVSGERIPSGYYKKPEVDAVIAEKDAEIAELQETNVIIANNAVRLNKDIAELKKKLEDAKATAYAPILFREDGDTRHDMVVKPELLEAYMKENYKKPPFAIFEDRDSMVAKWRELGYTCFQPAEGDF